MAQSTCGKCGAHTFRLEENSPSGARYKYMFIQCSSCGNVVSSTEYFSNNAEIQLVKNEIADLKSKMKNLENKVDFLVDGMENILRVIRK